MMQTGKDRILDHRKAFMELKFGPNWDYISTVRNFIINFLAITLSDKKRADRIAMAVNELVENATKYSDIDGIEIKLQVLNASNDIHVIVRNHTTEKCVRYLENIINEINTLPPLEAYITRMQESSKKPDEKSMIGLARIRYESNAMIRMESDEHNFVVMHAEFTVPVEGGPR